MFRFVRNTLLLCSGCLLFLFVSTAAFADVAHYIDSAGAEHFVSSLDKVPEAYRAQAAKAAPLPSLSHVTAFKSPLSDEARYPTSGGSKGRVEIFVTSWCPYCKKLEAYLKDENIQYTRYDIEHDAKGKKIHEELGGGGIPVVRIGKTVLHGFDPNALKAALKG